MVGLLKWGRLAAAVCAMGSVGTTFAAPVEYKGFDANARGSVPANSLAVAARNSFAGTLASLQTETFESYDLSTIPSALFAGSVGLEAGSKDATSNGIAKNVLDDNGLSAGRFNTTPLENAAKFWETSFSFTLTFAQAINGFGFYVTDVGDFDGQLFVTLINGDDERVFEVYSGDTSSSRSSLAEDPTDTNGSLLFWGITDDSFSFDKIVVDLIQGGQTDYLGFDDILAATVRDDPGTVPEPASLALAGLALAGAAVTRRRRRS